MGRVGGQFRGGRGGGQYRGGRGGGQFRGGRRGSRGRRDQQHQQRAGKLRTRDQTGAGSWECVCGYSNWSCRKTCNSCKAPKPGGPSNEEQAVLIQGQELLTASMLAATPPQEQKQKLGQRLFPLVQSMCPELAWKITGKLLESDNAELLHMLEDNNSLKKKVSPDNTALLYHTYTSLQVKMAMIQEKRKDLGEQLFPLVEKIRPDLARKITGMLLQIDDAELVLMMEDPTSLKGKVRPDTSFIVVSLVHPNTLLQVEEAVAVLQKNKEENMIE